MYAITCVSSCFCAHCLGPSLFWERRWEFSCSQPCVLGMCRAELHSGGDFGAVCCCQNFLMCFQIQLQVGSFWPRKRLTEVRGGFVLCNPYRYKTRDWNSSVQDWDQSRPLIVDEECSAGLPQFCRAYHRNHHMWVTPAALPFPHLHTLPVTLQFKFLWLEVIYFKNLHV